MNYRHIYHAGNFADVHKHLIFVLTLDYLQQKEKGLLVLDAFAGIGLYDLTRPEPQKTNEFREGIAKVMASAAHNPDLTRFQSVIQPFWDKTCYAGSPLLAAHLARPQDRVIANELHPEDVETLQESLANYASVRITQEDAYQSIRANNTVLPNHCTVENHCINANQAIVSNGTAMQRGFMTHRDIAPNH